MRIVTATVLVVIVVITFSLAWLAHHVLPIATGYFAKNMCSCMFIQQRSAESIATAELAPYWYISYRTNKEKKQVTASVLQLARSTAVYREGYGCTLARDINPDTLQAVELPDPAVVYIGMDTIADEFLSIHPLHFSIDSGRFFAAVNYYFNADSTPDDFTRALIVVHRGKIIAERYAEGFHRDMPQLGWSMAKTVGALMAGIADRQRLITHSQTALFPEWNEGGKSLIAVSDLVQMTSGLDFEERYNGVSDATIMLFRKGNMSRYAQDRPLAKDPGHFFNYAGGDTNILQWLLRSKLESEAGYLLFLHEYLFRPLLISGAVMETDAYGTYVSSSYMFARPVDWAKLGQLLLDDGQWNGRQIIFPEWTRLITTPSIASAGRYGGGVWMQEGYDEPDGPLPAGTYWMGGFQGQAVIVIPDKQLVLVRMGYTPNDDFDRGSFIRRFADAFYGPDKKAL